MSYELKKIFVVCLMCVCAVPARAWDLQYGRNAAKLTFEGATGSGSDAAFADFLARAQLSREFSDKWSAGFAYSFDGDALSARQFARDAFAYAEHDYGRLEFGWTDSVAAKLGLRLPDVGGTRLNNAPLFLRGMSGDGFVGITNPAVRGNQYAVRANIVTAPANPFQFGIGRTVVPAGTFDSSTDMGIKYRRDGGRIKVSAAAGLSHIERPRGLIEDVYLPPAFADARYQGTAGVNIHWGSVLWAATLKVVVDENPVGPNSEGIQLGTGASYDFLRWSVSASHIFSDVGIFRDNAPAISAHIFVVSARYKIDEHFNVWASVGTVQGGGADEGWGFVTGGVGAKF